ncbi:MAG TPA: DNA topoisomerase IB [Aliidongia sp.]|uniref:DNA topoisomerase IB n=1 Tax=Aliidongia sp. TaxID=1914230 RepID=UPI002DDD0A8C|nr:DNA topoisomerase IB [Aliidongia sp.]HEV2676146.1 DNA topoisomerase IB [Aliidongia sp.]
MAVLKLSTGPSGEGTLAVAAPAKPARAPSQIVATTVKLLYVSDQAPGITRRRSGGGWCYRDPDGTVIRDPATLSRIRSLAVPPAYRDVWICADPLGHIQASGRDARGRKQYRYHPAWRSFRDEAKYGHVATFIRALPRLRERVAADMARHGLPREKVLATLVRLMETTFIRIGNAEYAKQNKSFGLTTLRNRHAKITGNRVELSFQAKSGIKWHVVVRNRQLVSLVRRLRDLPGQDLFQYLDDDGQRHTLSSTDVNDYLRAVSEEEITAKDFRTWAGTYLSVLALAAEEAGESDADRKRAMLRVIEKVSAALGNTPAICRKCYIHPAVLDGHMTGGLAGRFTALVKRFTTRPRAGLSAEEAAVLALLEESA